MTAKYAAISDNTVQQIIFNLSIKVGADLAYVDFTEDQVQKAGLMIGHILGKLWNNISIKQQESALNNEIVQDIYTKFIEKEAPDYISTLKTDVFNGVDFLLVVAIAAQTACNFKLKITELLIH